MRFLRQLVDAYNQFTADDGWLMSAAVAYYAALSFFPLMLVLIAGLGFVLRFTALGQDAEQRILAAIADYSSPAMRDDVANVLGQVQDQAAVSGPVGLVIMLIAAGAIFAQFERAFDRIWNAPDPEPSGILAAIKNVLVYRLRAFLMLLALGVLLLVVFIATMTLSTVRTYAAQFAPIRDWVWFPVQSGATIVLVAGVFTLLYRLLAKAEVRWREALQGALVAAATWELGRLALASLVIGQRFTAYGVVGSFIAVMLWTYYVTLVIFLGAEYVQVICAEYNKHDAESP